MIQAWAPRDADHHQWCPVVMGNAKSYCQIEQKGAGNTAFPTGDGPHWKKDYCCPKRVLQLSPYISLTTVVVWPAPPPQSSRSWAPQSPQVLGIQIYCDSNVLANAAKQRFPWRTKDPSTASRNRALTCECY